MEQNFHDPLVLIIDAGLVARAAVRQAAEGLGWGVLEATDGLTGIELFRQYETAISLVVLDPSLPDLGGCDTCLRLRAMSHHRHTPLPILPYATTIEADQLLASLGCAPTLLKPASAEEIEQALRRTSTHLAHPTLPNAFLGYAYQKATATEQVVRQDRGHQPRAIVYVPAYGLRVGLAQVLRANGIQIVAETGSIQAVANMLSHATNHILVSDAEGCALASCVAAEHHVPLLVLAASEHQRQTLAQDDAVLHMAASVLDISTDEALRKLPQAFAAIQNGRKFICLDAGGAKEVKPEVTIPPHVVAYFMGAQLTRRSLELLWLDYQGRSTAEVARHLFVTEATVQSYWKRLQRKMRRTRGELRAWFRHKLGVVQLQG